MKGGAPPPAAAPRAGVLCFHGDSLLLQLLGGEKARAWRAPMSSIQLAGGSSPLQPYPCLLVSLPESVSLELMR